MSSAVRRPAWKHSAQSGDTKADGLSSNTASAHDAHGMAPSRLPSWIAFLTHSLNRLRASLPSPLPELDWLPLEESRTAVVPLGQVAMWLCRKYSVGRRALKSRTTWSLLI